MQYDFTISYILIADTLSSAPVIQTIEKDHDLLQDMNFYVKSVIKILPITEKRLEHPMPPMKYISNYPIIAEIGALKKEANLSSKAIYQVSLELSITEELLCEETESLSSRH